MNLSLMNKHVFKLSYSDAKNEINESFCLPEWSILIGHYETTGVQYFNLAKSHVINWNNTFYFGVDPIHLYNISTGL